MVTTRKTLVDYITEEDYARYNELLGIAEQNKLDAKEAKKAVKKERAPRGPMTAEQKAAATASKIAKLQAKLDALLAETKD